ncbi:hypothetical protein [Planctomicrobium sp. SH664]|uniref:hypothetical protein n=1 Tax=Planctomicrobium sp. SH664 TaxID=3448125 RepID=UPI003F5B95BE
MARWPRQFGIAYLALSAGCVSLGRPVSFSPKSHPGQKPEAQAARQDAPPANPVDPVASTTNGSARHDPATRMLIDAELKDATPQERAEWLAYLETVSADKVPYILKARRIEVSRRTELLAKSTSSPTVTPASHAEPGGPIPHIIPGASSALAQVSAADTTPGQETHPTTAWSDRFKLDRNALWPERSAFGLPKKPMTDSHAVQASATAPHEIYDPVTTTPPPSDVRLTPGAALWEDELRKLISLLEAETSSAAADASTLESREHLRKQVAFRLLLLVANEPEKAQQAIPGISPAEQEFWSTLFVGLSQLLDQSNSLDPTERATQTIMHLRTAANQLQQSARLQLRNVTFCEQINSFGNYQPFETDHFRPGQPLLIYAEVRNFSSEPTISGYYRTRIKSTIEISKSGSDGEVVDQNTFDATEDLSRTLRSDYYHSYRVDLPAHLQPGSYILKLTIQDELTGRAALETIGFQIQ